MSYKQCANSYFNQYFSQNFWQLVSAQSEGNGIKLTTQKMFILTMMTLVLVKSQQLTFPQGSMSYSMSNYQVGASSTRLAITFNINIQLPSQAYIDFNFPQQNKNLVAYSCATNVVDAECILLQARIFQLRMTNAPSKIEVTFSYITNPSSNFSDPIQVICKNALTTMTLFQFQFTIPYTLQVMDGTSNQILLALTLKLDNSLTLTRQSLSVSFNLTKDVPQGGFLILSFPPINPGSSINEYPMQSDSACKFQEGFTNMAQCNFKGGQLLVTDSFTQPKVYSFTLSNFISPYSINTDSPVSIFLQESSNSFIAQSIQVIRVITVSNKLPLTLESSNNKIRGTTILIYRFNTKLILINSIIVISFNNMVSVDQSKLQGLAQIGSGTWYQIETQYQFGATTSSVNSIIYSQIQLIGAIKDIVENSQVSLQINGIINQKYEDLQEQFTVTILDQNTNPSQQGIVGYQSVAESLKQFNVVLTNNKLRELSNYTFTLTPLFQLQNAQINITVPIDLQFPDEPYCSEIKNLGPNATCSFQNGSLSISNITQPTQGQLEFTILKIQNPNDILKSTPFSVQISEDGKTLIKDQNLKTIQYIPYDLNLRVQSLKEWVTGSLQNVMITIDNSINWQSNFNIHLIVPQEFQTDQMNCTVDQGFQCEAQSNYLLLTNDKKVSLTNIEITLKNIRMPRSLAPVTAIKGELWNNYLIASGESDQLQLSQVPSIQFTAVTSSYLIAIEQTWAFEILLDSASISSNDVLSIGVPIDVTNASCYQTLPLESFIPCTYSDQLHMIMISQEHTIISKLQLRISSLRNPLTASADRNWTLRISDNMNYSVATASYQSPPWILRTLAKPTLELSNLLLGETTDLSINFQNSLEVPPGGSIQLDFQEQYFERFNIDSAMLDQNQTNLEQSEASILFPMKNGMIPGNHNLTIAGVKKSQSANISDSNILNVNYRLKSNDERGGTLEQGDFSLQIQYACSSECSGCQEKHDQCHACSSDSLFLYSNSTCLDSCGQGFVVADHNCLQCQTDSSCLTCSSTNQSMCLQCSLNYTLIDGGCEMIANSQPSASLPSLNASATSSSNSSSSEKIQGTTAQDSTEREIVGYYFILTTMVFLVLILAMIRKCCYKQTRFLTLSYGWLVVIQNAMELIFIIEFFLIGKLDFAFASLSLLVMHLISQLYSVTQTSFTLKIDGDYYSYKRQYGSVLFVHLLANLFSYRSIVLMLSRVSKGGQWDGVWSHRVQVLEQISVLLKICSLYSICFLAITITYIVLTDVVQLFYFELAAFLFIVLCLDIYHQWLINMERNRSLRQRDSDQFYNPVLKVKELERDSSKASQVVPVDV